MISTPSSDKSKTFNISLATFISSTGFSVKETLKVAPIPSTKRAPIPIADFTVPWNFVPASVTPVHDCATRVC